MRRIAFIIMIIGLIVLFGIMVFLGENLIDNNSDLDELEINSKVLLEGIVYGERDFGEFIILNINGIDVICDCENSFLNKNIRVEGIVEEYDNRKQVKVLKIS